MTASSAPQTAIAIVGMSGRFPGAPTLADFWRNLCAGVESITRFEPDELEDAFSPEVRARPEYVRARAILPDVDQFDAAFFGITSRDADLMDPQHRLLLECSWEALEDAGYDPATFSGAIGVYAGCTINTYVLRNVLTSRDAVARFTSDYQVGSYPELLGAGQDFLATRVAYKLNLRGPAMTVQSACSTSLMAVGQACQALIAGQADMMLAGAVSISFPQKRGYLHQAGGMVSADGHCRTFDAAASGTVFGDGAGVVVLKRLDDALRDGDSVYAVIRGVGMNNDGSAKAGYTAPSSSGESGAVSAAHAMAGFAPESIRYVECHGTATPLGDPIEFAALATIFPAGDGGPYCALGSVKTNIGHLDVAAGMSGLIKAALAIHHAEIPPTLHFSAPNPRIALAGSPFFVNSDRLPWPADDARRRAGVSAFGVGGTNVHVVLEAAPVHVPSARGTDTQLLVLSARSEAALSAAAARLSERLRAAPELDLGDVAFTLQAGRRAFAHRAAFNAGSVAEALTALERASLPSIGAVGAPAIAFMFPGQGAQYVNMGRGLYDRFPLFRETIDRCAAIVEPIIGRDLRGVLYPGAPAAGADALLADTAYAQPALFAVEYALARLWLSWGIEPTAMIGHSVGEFVAATLAGVFTFEDAAEIVAVRARLMQDLPRGAMLAVRTSEADLREMLGPELDVAARNSPKLAVAAGPFDAIERLEGTLSERNIAFRRLATSHAFHSAMLDAILEPLLERFERMPLRVPQLPYVSGVTGDWITAEQATSPHYWTRHCRETVRFEQGLRTIAAGGANALLEIGPGTALKTFAGQTLGTDAGLLVTGSLREATLERSDHAVLLESLGRLWCAGAAPDWAAVHAPATPRRVSLPTYPFERRRHWLESRETAPVAQPSPPAFQPRMDDPPLPTPLPTEAADRDASSLRLERELSALLEELSGETVTAADRDTTFLELGFDSLFLGRFVQKLASAFGVTITFRSLMTDLPTIAMLSAHIAAQRPPAPVSEPAVLAGAAVAPVVESVAPVVTPSAAVAAAPAAAGSGFESIVRDQLAAMQQLMREQLQAMQGLAIVPATVAATAVMHAPAAGAVVAQAAPQPVAAAPVATPPLATSSAAAPPAAAGVEAAEPASRFDVFRAAASASRGSEMTPAQRAHIADLVARTVERTRRSKELTARHRPLLADPRVAAGFRPEWKEMVYPIACDRAKGSRLWDVDGNEYIDVLNGFGQTAFGHSPDFVVEAVARQLHEGFPIGPQTPLAGEVAELFCELTGNERVTFCNTGSEAVMAALRVARTVTGRDRVVMFSGAYHGQFDEVLVKAARNSQRALPVAPGIPNQSVANMVVLPYADRASLAWVREHAAELAAVVVEPVQSRHPDLQPREFLTEIRAITQASGTAFVIDEVVTGFRIHPGGMQAVFDIRADLATYGKVAGGGMPIGILAGKARFMDALDGGMWQYGDDSGPEVPPTFFAGTFVRHPLTMAAVLAVLRHLKEAGPELQAALSARTAGMVARLNRELESRGITSRIETYGSLFYFNFTSEERLASLLYYHLRLRGVYIQEGFPCFLTTAHTAADIDLIVSAFAQSLDALQAVGIFGTAPVPAEALEVPLTEQQTEIWLAAQLGDEASCAFNESITLRLTGALDESAFARAWNEIVRRHDALRAAFNPTGEFMRIDPAAGFAYERSDFGGPAADADLATAIADDAATPFDLVAGPLVRGHLFRLAADRHVFVFTAHHIVCDGWSFNVMLGEFAALYAAYRNGTPSELPVPMPFSRYAESRRRRDPAEIARIEAFWLEAFREPVTPLALPLDRPRPAVRSFRGATHSMHVDAARYRAVKKAGARHGCTLFVTLLAGFSALVGRLAQTRDVVVGVPAAGQALLDGETLVGHCVDFLPIRVRWDATTSLADLLAGLKTRVLAAYEHQDYTLGTLVRKLDPVRETNRVPLAEIQFNLERLAEDLTVPGLTVSTAPNAKAFVNFDLFLNVIESDAGLRLDCDYNTDLFDAPTIERWLRAYVDLLDAIAADATRPASLPTLDAVQAEAVGGDAGLSLAINRADYPRTATLVSLIAAQVAQRPDAVALTCGDDVLTYAQLDARTARLAWGLRARFGTDGGRIGICVPRSIDMAVALLGTLRAGFSYVPLDPTHPPARLRYILADAGVVALLASENADATLAPPATPIVSVAAVAGSAPDGAHFGGEAQPAPDAPAYVIYTSGSTGTPKGVEIAHGSVVNFLCSMAREPGFGPDDTLLAVTTISFDIAGLELYLPLICGGTVAIADDAETHDGQRLRERLGRTRATMLQATPATWRMLLETDFDPAPGFKLLCGGEALRRDLADRLIARGGELWNMYGPTETTIWSSCARVGRSGPVTVGRPIANTTFAILDGADRPVPAGATGQLHIGGDGVARGYVNRDALTAEKFIPNPLGEGRLYRTGDTARMLASGDFEILGRMDEQVKLRGYRIELGEIEATLTRYGAVAAATVAFQEKEQRLVAYYIERKDAPVAQSTLQSLAQEHLPDYMVPAVWVKLEALPLNANGKVDRSALPTPVATESAEFIEASTPTERALAEIWADVLTRERVSVRDDIFMLGADSIQIFQITARANRKGLPVLAKQLMKHRTIAELAKTIDAGETPAAPASRPPIRTSHPPLRSNGERAFVPLA